MDMMGSFKLVEGVHAVIAFVLVEVFVVSVFDLQWCCYPYEIAVTKNR